MTGPAPRIEADVLRRAVSLLDLLPAGAEVKRIGRDAYVTLCCFHSEDRPSLRVTLFKGVWRFKCFPCGAAGDALDFVQRTTGLSFQDALAKLADGRGLDLTVTTRIKRRVPRWLLVCDARGCTASLEVEDEDVVYLGETTALAWWVGANRAYCGACVAEKRGHEPHWRPSDETRAVCDAMNVRAIQFAGYGHEEGRAAA